MRAQKVILQGPVSRPPTPVAHSCAPSRWSGGSRRSARPPLGSAPPRELLVELHHTDGARGLVVVKGHGQIVHKGQHFPLVGYQAVAQVLRGALFDAPALSGGLCCAHGRRIGGPPRLNHPLVAHAKLGALCLRQRTVHRLGGIDCRLELHEQRRQRRRPALLLACLDARQGPQGMGIPHTRGDIWRGAGRLPVVVHRPPCQRGQHPDGSAGF